MPYRLDLGFGKIDTIKLTVKVKLTILVIRQAAEYFQFAAEDPELEEFLRVMQPRKKAATWADDGISPVKPTNPISKQPVPKRKAKQSLTGKTPKGLPEDMDTDIPENGKKGKRKRSELKADTLAKKGEEKGEKKKRRKEQKLEFSPSSPLSDGVDTGVSYCFIKEWRHSRLALDARFILANPRYKH